MCNHGVGTRKQIAEIFSVTLIKIILGLTRVSLIWLLIKVMNSFAVVQAVCFFFAICCYSDALLLTLSDLPRGNTLLNNPSKTVDVAIIGAGIGGLSCASILSSVYGIHT